MKDKAAERLFFGCQIQAAWPETLPEGRIVQEGMRHITLAFLGNQDPQKVLTEKDALPTPPFSIAPVGIFKSCLFLPPRRPRLVAYDISWLDDPLPFLDYQKTLENWLAEHNYLKPEQRDFWPHVTLCRYPFQRSQWQNSFQKCPFKISGLHLYKSLGFSQYVPIYSMPLVDPFCEMEHTADMAYCVRARTLTELHMHAQLALAFHFAAFIDFFVTQPPFNSLDDVIGALNSMIAHTDATIGCPLKAVSFHGELKKLPDGLLEWEMIVDV